MKLKFIEPSFKLLIGDGSDAISVKFIVSRSVTRNILQHGFDAIIGTPKCEEMANGELQFIIPERICDADRKYLLSQCVTRFDTMDNLEGIISERSSSRQFVSRCVDAASTYYMLVHEGWSPQQASMSLPNCIADEITVTGYSVSWHSYLSTVTNAYADAQLKEIMVPLVSKLYTISPLIWGDIIRRNDISRLVSPDLLSNSINP